MQTTQNKEGKVIMKTIGILAQYYGTVNIDIPDTIDVNDEQALRINIRARYCGTVEIPIPEHIDASDNDVLKKYVDSIWDDVELPELDYTPHTEPDWESPWYINGYIETNKLKDRKLFEKLKRQMIESSDEPKLFGC